MSGIAIFNEAVSQLQNQQHNLLKVKEARQRMEADKERNDFEKKKRALELEDAERKGELSSLQADAFRAQTKAYEKQQDEIAKGSIAQIKFAEHQSMNAAEQALNWAKIGYKSDPQGVTDFLRAVNANEQRKRMIVPEFSYGRVGYTTKDIEQPKPDKPEYTRKDVIAVARGNRGAGVPLTDEDIAKAEELLSGKKAEPAQQQDLTKPLALSLELGRSAQQPTQSKPSASSGKIKMRLPNGQSVYIPEANVEAAKKRGAIVL